MAELLLIRHGKTYGNQKGRYIGCQTDEPLCEEGREELKNRICNRICSSLPEVERIYTSPLRRCVETAKILWPDFGQLIRVPGLRECDFGNFENKNYEELSGNPDYQAWIDSGGTLPFPGGEALQSFKRRCCDAFAGIVKALIDEGLEGRTALVVHGGTIMAVLERYGFPKKTYFDYQVKNGQGYLLTPVEGTDLWYCQRWP